MTSSPPEIRLRPAEAGDVDLLLGWANDPVARAVSFTTAPIPRADHVAWFERALANPDRHLLIAMVEGVPVATLRLDAGEGPGEAVISVNVGPESRGRGIGRGALEAATGEAARLGFARIVAWIRPETAASLRAFEAAGYSKVSEGVLQGQLALRYERAVVGS